MNFFVLFVLCAFQLFSLSDSSTLLQYALRFQGVCMVGATASVECNSQATSQQITTAVTDDGLFTASISPFSGGKLVWLSTRNVDGNTFQEVGNFTFAQSGLTFSGSGLIDQYCFSGTLKISGGSGKLQGAQGYVSYSACTQADTGDFTAFVSASVLTQIE